MCSMYFPNYEEFKSFVEIFTPNNQTLIWEKQLFLSNMDFIFETDQAQIYCHPPLFSWEELRVTRTLQTSKFESGSWYTENNFFWIRVKFSEILADSELLLLHVRSRLHCTV